MRVLRWIRCGAWTAVASLALLSAAILFGWWRVDGPGRDGPLGRVLSEAPPAVGGPFTLVDQTGNAVTERDLLGRPTAVFFGFTYCPEVCPTTLLRLGGWMKRLGAEAERLQVLMVSVDPERDTPEQLALYLQSFDPRVRGLTGTQAQVDAALSAYKAYAKRIRTEGGYTMDHTALIYLMKPDGGFRTAIDYHEEDTAAVAKLRLILR